MNRPKLLAAGSFIAGLAALTFPLDVAYAVNVVTSPLQNGTTKTVMISGDVTTAGVGQIVYTVPGGYSLELTDIVITNYLNVFCDTVFTNGPNYVSSEFRAPRNGMLALNLHTGLYFAAKAPVSLFTDQRIGGGVCTPTFTLIGTLTKLTPPA